MADRRASSLPKALRGSAPNMSELFGVERPKIVETVSWAASLGDRSENADYIYGKRRLREIDRRLGYLAQIMKAGQGRRPGQAALARPGPLRRHGRACRRRRQSPDADHRRRRRGRCIDRKDRMERSRRRALIGARVGDERIVRLPVGEKSYEVMRINYPSS